nr:hypothetical protein Iba_chr06cCG15340 [Ipomoea batatas]
MALVLVEVHFLNILEADQHQPVGDEERSDFRVGDLRESCDVRDVRTGGRAACVKPRGEKPRTALCLCLLCSVVDWSQP